MNNIRSYIFDNWGVSVKYYIGIASILLMNSLHIIFFQNDNMYDVYLFYSHERYLTNILYDTGNIYSANILFYFLTKYKRNIFLPIFYTSLAMWITYFVFYNQLASLILIPFYLCTAILIQIKQARDNE